MNESIRFRTVWWWLAGLVAVAAARLLTLPKSLWEWDEVLFVRGVEHFDPLHHSPHPPGYPLLIGLGKALAWITGDPFAALVALSVISSLVGFVALAAAFRSFAGGGEEGERVGLAGALLFHLSPAMLVYGPLALSDPPALMFLSLALLAVARLVEHRTLPAALALGAFASAAIGCRPQLCLAVLPMLAVTLALAGWRKSWAVLAAFTAVSLLWFVPLVSAVGGPSSLVPFLTRQAGLVAAYDTAGPRSGMSWRAVMLRFVAHPWGDRWTSLPLLLFAGLGAAELRRSRIVFPLAVLTAVELAFALAVMNPRDAVRYALPSMLGVAFAAGFGAVTLMRRRGIPAGTRLVTVAFAAGFVFYTWPVLFDRTLAPSTPVQAIRWAQDKLPRESVFLVDKELGAHVAYLLPRSRATFDEGFAGSPDLPVWLIAEGDPGDDGPPGTLRFRWLGSDAYGKLTRGLYRVTSLIPIPPGRRYRVERGVYGYEPTAREAAWRWLAPEAAIRLVPGGARELTLDLALPTVAPLASNRVAISVAGAPAAEVEIQRGERRTVALPLPVMERTTEVEVAFRSATSFVPAGAPRRLAVQLVDLEMK